MSDRFIPHAYQNEIIQFIQKNKRCAVWALMGTGKTVSTLTALNDLTLVEDDIFPALVLAPLRVARTVWGPEVEKWAHLNKLKVSVVTGTAKQRDKALDTPADIYAINYDNLVWLAEGLGDDWPFKTVIADESTRLKSFRLMQGSKRARALSKVAFSKIERFVNLTGTPSPNGLKDLWGQTWFLDKGTRLGNSFSAFERRWFTRGRDGFSIQPMAHAQHEIQSRLTDICLTVKGLDVEQPIFNNVYIDLPDDVRPMYRTMEKEMYALIKKEGVTAANAAVKTSKLLQICNGAIYSGDPDKPEEKRKWTHIHDEKITALKSVLEEAAGAPVMTAYNFRHDLERLIKAFPRARVLDAKASTIDDWNAGKIDHMLAHPASAGHGLNLARGGNILAFFGLNWALEEYLQIIERIGPMRQKQLKIDRPVFVHRIVARGCIDHLDVLQRLAGKKSVQDILLEATRRYEAAA